MRTYDPAWIHLYSHCCTGNAWTSSGCEFCFTTAHMNSPYRSHLQEDGEVISQHLHGPDATGLMKTIITSYWIAHTDMSIPDVGVDTRWCLVNKGLERGALLISQSRRTHFDSLNNKYFNIGCSTIWALILVKVYAIIGASPTLT